jgi:hypothetical protein
MRFRFTVRDLLWLTALVAMGVGWWADHLRIESFAIAANPEMSIEQRVATAMRLSSADQELLRAKLAAELPGDWDRRTLDSIMLLGTVGNAESADVLAEIDRSRTNVSGRFGPAIDYVIAQIRSRTHAKQ